jgi:hypothetical protein
MYGLWCRTLLANGRVAVGRLRTLPGCSRLCLVPNTSLDCCRISYAMYSKVAPRQHRQRLVHSTA